MDQTRFDGISKLFAQRRLSRRQAMRQGAAGLAAAGLTATGLKTAAAQDATPAAGGEGAAGVEFLFLQSFESGTIAPKDGADGTYTLTLQHGLGQTLYFSDRPDRIVGASPTQTFLEGLGFGPDNPPNAALVVDTGEGGIAISVVELTSPSYDVTSFTATYDVTVLQNYQREVGMQFQEATEDLAQLAGSFGSAHLFIDDCPNGDIQCYASDNELQAVGGYFNQPFCYNYLLCIPCEPYGNAQPDRCSTVEHWIDKCSRDYNQQCGTGGCNAEWPSRPFLGC